LAPDWAPYRTINGQQIRHYLHTEHGVKVATTGHKYPVDPTAIRDAITRRDTTRDPATDPAGDPACGLGGRS
jgi:DNA segregation ATPase FtsK/SpoIIIE, S-DNA-T family